MDTEYIGATVRKTGRRQQYCTTPHLWTRMKDGAYEQKVKLSKAGLLIGVRSEMGRG